MPELPEAEVAACQLRARVTGLPCEIVGLDEILYGRTLRRSGGIMGRK